MTEERFARNFDAVSDADDGKAQPFRMLARRQAYRLWIALHDWGDILGGQYGLVRVFQFFKRHTLTCLAQSAFVIFPH